MVEYHGWISIHQSTDGEDEDEIVSIAENIRDIIDKISSPNQILILKPINGVYILHLAGVTNHRAQDVNEIFELIELIASKARGSYGLLYLKDDEDQKGRDNEFIVYKLYRGRIEESSDKLLSPCNPVIMD